MKVEDREYKDIAKGNLTAIIKMHNQMATSSNHKLKDIATALMPVIDQIKEIIEGKP